MLVFKRNKYLLRIAEVYFNTGELNNITGIDVVMYVQSACNKRGAKEFNTLLIDLGKDEQVLFAELSRNTRDKIKKAHNKDELQYIILTSPSEGEIQEFITFYDIFAVDKGLSGSNRKKLQALNQCASLVLTLVKDKNERVLCYHAYITDGNRVRCLYSASHYRNFNESSFRSMLGRANRYLHWMDIRSFKEKGYRYYDFGGLSLDKSNQDLKNIDDFKRGFGGTTVKEYNYFHPKSVLGRIAVKLKRFY